VALAVAGASAAVGALPQRVARPALGSAGALYARSPLNRARLARAVEQIRWCFPDLDEADARGLAVASWRRLALLAEELSFPPARYRHHRWPDWIEPPDAPQAVAAILDGPTVLVTGHCGNWEVMGAWLGSLGLPLHAVYRPLDNLALDRWVRRTRLRKGIDLVDKFGAGASLPALLERGEPVAFTADQDAGRAGVFVPFFDRLASSYKAVGLLAMQHDTPIVCGGAICVREAPVRFRVVVSDVIRPDDWADRPDPLYYITARWRRAIESLVRQAPEQFLWMQRYWRRRPPFERRGEPLPASWRDRLESLPWMTPESLARIERSCTPPARPR